jgi:choline dehydrogenase
VSLAGYDVVVVGAGTAGCVVAARLAAAGARVMLTEAGNGGPPVGADVPSAFPTFVGSGATWGDVISPQPGTGTAPVLARGRGLGGSSAINGMIFTRGHHSGYADWPVGWRFDDLLPYFKRTENAVGRDPAVRGVGGPLTVGPADPLNPVIEAGLDAAVRAGYRRVDDVSSGLVEGFGAVDLNIVAGRRQSVVDAYLRPALGRGNIDVVGDAVAQRLLFSGPRCVGVQYRKGPTTATVMCDTVVLAAGAVGTSQLLLLSGVGPTRDLSPNGIETIHDLPGVGVGLQDHPLTSIVYESARPVPQRVSGNHAEAIGLVRSGPHLLQFVLMDYARRLPGVNPPEHGFTIAVSVIRPHSRGGVRLANADPETAPIIDPGYYRDERDLDAAVAGLRIADRIGTSHAWRKTRVAPGEDDLGALFVRRTTSSYFHPVGGCAIGEVVDDQLRIRGLDGIYVADASVMPSIPAGNPQATVYAIAERAAELIAGK